MPKCLFAESLSDLALSYGAFCSSTGDLFKCLPYTGKSDYFDKHLGLGASVVMELLKVAVIKHSNN